MTRTFAQVLEQQPELTAMGFRSRGMDQWTFDQQRRKLEGGSYSQIASAIRFLDGAEIGPRMAYERSTKDLSALAGAHQFGTIAPGAMIAALLMAGVPVKSIPDSPHVRYGIKAEWINKIRQEALQRLEQGVPGDWPYDRADNEWTVHVGSLSFVQQFGH